MMSAWQLSRAVVAVCAALSIAARASGAQALDIMKAPYAPPDSTVVTAVRAGWLVDVDAGRVLRDRVVIVRGERIVSVEAAPGHIPAGAKVVDLSQYTVTPGLIDCHTHLIGGETSANYLVPLERSAAQETLDGVVHARRTLLSGFTTVRDVGTYRAFLDIALRDYINDGLVMGPRMAVAGAYITVSSGGGEIAGQAADVRLPADMRVGIANSASEVRQRVREILNRGADVIKVIATGAVLTSGTKPGVEEFSEEEIHAAVTEAAKYGARVAAHAHGSEGIKAAVRAGVASIEHGSMLDDEGIKLMKEHGTYLVSDLIDGEYIRTMGHKLGWSQEILHKDSIMSNLKHEGFRKAVAAGVKMAFGTDASVYPNGENAQQFPLMIKFGGMTPMQILQAATINAATLIGWQSETGSIAPGKRADLVAVVGDGLADVGKFAHMSFVMKSGIIYLTPVKTEAP
ncbi:MAG: amidohydrolase family protein [Gemmatimonadaceae bacterium]|nr:amidohydrolase family protein [Gemmatimonadaceae bacterium]